MEVQIFSREKIEKMLKADEDDPVIGRYGRLLKKRFPENAAVISFFDKRRSKSYKPVDYSAAADRVFHVELDDVLPVELLSNEHAYEAYFPQAVELAEFIHKAQADGFDFICQCEYGKSRSAACAAAILEYFEHNGIVVFADYRYDPNKIVYHKLMEAMTEYDNRSTSYDPEQDELYGPFSSVEEMAKRWLP